MVLEFNTSRQRWAAFFAALVLGALLCIATLGAQDDGGAGDGDDHDNEFIYKPYYPGICDDLRPWSYWWYFWNCYQPDRTGERAESETVTTTQDADGTVTTDVERRYADGSVVRFRRVKAVGR